MTGKEVRMRCIEAVSHMGVREPSRMVKDAKVIEEYVNAAEDKDQPPKRAPRAKKTEDKE